MSSTLSYTITSSQNKFVKYLKNNIPFQIMPTQRTPLNYLRFPEITDSFKNQILLHTGYDVRPFSQDILSSTSYQHILLKSYILSAQRLGLNTNSNNTSFSQLLIHGPDSEESAKYLKTTLPILKEYSTTSNINICIEMPAFSKSIWNVVPYESNFEFIEEYFRTVIEYKLPIVIDTAHLHSNGLNVEQMITLLKEFEDNYTFIHLNGNSRDMFKKDKHTTFTELSGFENNKIKDADNLLAYVSKIDKICISEQKCNNLDYFNKLGKTYGFNVINNIPSNLII